MLEDFNKYIAKYHLIGDNDQILVAVSGGVDSMVMLHLFMKSHYKIAIAHCNFQLRFQDSFEDEKLVLDFAKKNNIQCFNIRFDTQNYAKENGISIEMAARKLRYNWFDELIKQHSFSLLATAHHQDDAIETFFLNIIRKTGLSGLHGIKQKNNYIIRPMLFCQKRDIQEYAKKNKIPHREDITNQDDSFLRNYIRLHIVPAFENLNNHAKSNIISTINILQAQDKLYQTHIAQISENLLHHCANYDKFNISDLKKLNPLTTYLYELLKPYGINFSQSNQLALCLDFTEEKKFKTQTHLICKTRAEIQIFSLTKQDNNEENLILNLNLSDFEKVKMNFEIIDFQQNFIFSKDKSIFYCDLDKLKFPLCIRKWQHGDYFYPLKGKGKKKISDFYSENKFSDFEKENTKLLCDTDNQILWIIGYRADNRIAICKNTKKILIIKKL